MPDINLDPYTGPKLLELTCAANSASEGPLDRLQVHSTGDGSGTPFVTLAVFDGSITDTDTPAVVWLDRKGVQALRAALDVAFPRR